MKTKELLIRIDERVTNLIEEFKERDVKIEKICNDSSEMKTTVESLKITMSNHVNMHKRDIGLIGIGLTALTIILTIVSKFI